MRKLEVRNQRVLILDGETVTSVDPHEVFDITIGSVNVTGTLAPFNDGQESIDQWARSLNETRTYQPTEADRRIDEMNLD